MKKYLRVILIVLILINCVIIFNFSSEKSEKSSQTSGKIVNTIIEANPKTKKLSAEKKANKKMELEKPVRKIAHFTVYMSLGILLFSLFNTYKITYKTKFIISIISAFMYACTDEIHQLFVPGRSGQFTDVLIDSCGAIMGIFIVCFFIKFYKKIIKKE